MTQEAFAYIEDGYMYNGYIEKIDRLYPALRFVYRPTLSQNRARILDEMAAAKAEASEHIAARMIASRVKTWNLKDRNGKGVEVSTASALRLQPRLAKNLFNIVMGEIPTDVDPEESPESSSSNGTGDLAAALAGTSPEELEAEETKN